MKLKFVYLLLTYNLVISNYVDCKREKLHYRITERITVGMKNVSRCQHLVIVRNLASDAVIKNAFGAST